MQDLVQDQECISDMQKVNKISPATNRYAICERCDNATPLVSCPTHHEWTCGYCHHSDIANGFHN